MLEAREKRYTGSMPGYENQGLLAGPRADTSCLGRGISTKLKGFLKPTTGPLYLCSIQSMEDELGWIWASGVS